MDSGLLYFPDFVEMYGQDERHWDLSMAALERYTRYSTAEFAVRPFIIKHEARMIAQMTAWTEHDNEHVRRLASEGCRPALPWGQALTSFKKDPSPVLQILERLKAGHYSDLKLFTLFFSIQSTRTKYTIALA